MSWRLNQWWRSLLTLTFVTRFWWGKVDSVKHVSGNVAYNKTANHGPDPWRFPSERAIDGNHDPEMGRGSCVWPHDGDRRVLPWWQVDLGDTYVVISVRITNRNRDRRKLQPYCQPTNRINTLRPRQNGHQFADDILKCIFLNINVWIPIEISPKFVPKGTINNIPSLVQIMAWRRSGDKPSSEPMMIRLPTHICVTRPQWVKWTVEVCLDIRLIKGYWAKLKAQSSRLFFFIIHQIMASAF